MAVNLAILHRIDDTVNGDFAVHQVGKGRRITKFEIGNLPLIQAEFLKAVVGKILAYNFLRINVVNIVRIGNRRSRYSIFPGNRRLAHVKGHGQDSCRHGQGRKDPAHFQGFGFGTGLFAAPSIAVISVCHRSYLLSVFSFSICSSFCLQKEYLLFTGIADSDGNRLPRASPGLISCIFRK